MTAPIPTSTESAEQLSTDTEKPPTVDTRSEKPKDLGRWDEAWEEHERQQLQGEEQEESHVILPKGNSLFVHRLIPLVYFQMENL